MNPTSYLKTITIIIISLFILSSLGGSHPYTSLTSMYNGITHYVGGSGPGNYSNITMALQNSSNGDTIYVYPGFYDEESLDINISVSIIGEDKNITILNNTMLDFKTTNISLCDFTFEFGGLEIGNQTNTTGNNHVFDNIFNNSFGLIIGFSNDNSIENNTFFNCGIFMPFILEDEYHISNKIYNNFVNDKPLFYFEDSTDKIISDAGQIILLRCINITIENCLLTGYIGWTQISNSRNVTIKNNEFIDHLVWLHKTSYGLIESNIFNLDNSVLVLFEGCTGNKIKKNSFNSGFPLILWNSSDNMFIQNNFLKKFRLFEIRIMMSFNSHNFWDGNYWFRPRILPKLIWVTHISPFNWNFWYWTLDIDLYPARKPNDTPEISTNIHIIDEENYEVFNHIITSSNYLRLLKFSNIT